MILKVMDEQDFNLCMRLNIDYELGYIEVTVRVWNKKTDKFTTKTFPAAEFAAALAYFRQQKEFFFDSKEKCDESAG